MKKWEDEDIRRKRIAIHDSTNYTSIISTSESPRYYNLMSIP